MWEEGRRQGDKETGRQGERRRKMSSATLTAARAAESMLVEQLHSTADALASIGQNAIQAALERIGREADALKGRIMAARAMVACELGGVLEAFESLTADLEQGSKPLQSALPETAQRR